MSLTANRTDLGEFAHKDLKTLCITASTSLYKIRLNATGFLVYPAVKR